MKLNFLSDFFLIYYYYYSYYYIYIHTYIVAIYLSTSFYCTDSFDVRGIYTKCYDVNTMLSSFSHCINEFRAYGD